VGGTVGGVFGLIGCGAMMAIGRRNRSSLAADGATGIPWVLAGLTLIAQSSGIVGGHGVLSVLVLVLVLVAVAVAVAVARARRA